MSICCGCGTKFDFDTPGVMIKSVSADISPKSGRPIPQEDVFPDGTKEKFICAACVIKHQGMATLLGFYEQGFDFPPEEDQVSESTYVHSVPETYLPWGTGT